jgi:protein SSXT
MSQSFPTKRFLPEGVNQQKVQRLLDENIQLIQAVVDYQNKGRAQECEQYQQVLHRNLVYLASLADSTGSKPEQSKSAGPGAVLQSPGDGAVEVSTNTLAAYGSLRRTSRESTPLTQTG